MNNLPLQPLKWFELKNTNRLICEVVTPICEYSVWKDVDSVAYSVLYYNRHTEAPTKEATGFATIDEAKAWAWKHYNEKMQPHVKPMPTWIDASEQLPEMYQRVLIKADCYLVAGREPKSERNKDWGITGEWMWSIVNDNWCDAHMVTHWMPIPEFSTMQNLHKGGVIVNGFKLCTNCGKKRFMDSDRYHPIDDKGVCHECQLKSEADND